MADHALEGRTFEWLWQIWDRRKWLAVVVAVLVFAAIAGIVTFLPALYKSTATVLVERYQVSESLVRPSITGELETRLQTISQEILSRARLQELITRVGLYRDLRERVPMDLIVEKMRRDIRLELKGVDQTSGRGTTIAFTLSYRGRDPETVAQVTNTLASFYVAANVKLREEQASGTAGFLRAQLAEMKARLADQEQRVREYRTRHAGELPEQTTVNLATMERLHAQLHLNSADQLRATDRRAALAKQLADANLAGAAETPDVTVGQIAKLRQELIRLRQRFTDKYPEVARLKSDIAALERTLAESRAAARAEPARAVSTDPTVRGLQASLAETESQLEVLKIDEERLRRDIGSYQRRIENAPRVEQEFKELSRDYDTTRELYGSLLKRYEDAHLAESMEQRQQGEQFRILDAALPARLPAAPNRVILLIVGLLVSLGAAVALVMLVEHIDTSFHTVDDLRRVSAAPVLVSIPLIVTEGDRRRHKLRFALGAVAVTVLLSLVIKASHYVATGNELLVGLLARGSA